MQYMLRDDLSCCVIGGHAVFLDIGADRYFCLPERLERAFIAHANGSETSGAAVPLLVERNILKAHQSFGSCTAPRMLGPPTRSACEMPHVDTGPELLAISEAMAIVCLSRRSLRKRPIKEVLDRTVRYREQRCMPPVSGSTTDCEQTLLQAAARFRSARLYVPVATCCLLDSLALARFLARRRLHSSIVFGVTYEPFSAHCWVQCGDLALNETVGNATTHTIIRVV